jgi:diguanylate cyclase (GGDEF)-like protein
MEDKTKEQLLNELEELRKRIAELEKAALKHKILEEQLREVTIRDELTGLLNRRGFFTFAEKQCEIAGRNNLNLSFLFLDLDGMKKINDEFGHKVGDEALIDTANILKKSFRASDIIARIGGDEFVIIIMETPETHVEPLTVRFKANLNTHNTTEKKSYKLSLSFGLTKYSPENPCAIDKLISEADKLMYGQKRMKKA